MEQIQTQTPTLEIALKSICRLLKDYLQLDDEHIYLYCNKWVIPKDGKLCVVVGTGQEIPYHSSTRVEGLEEENTILSTCTLNIDVFSINREALYRKNEILMALNTSEAQNLFSRYGFYVPKIPQSFNQVNELDGATLLTRYNISFNMFYKTSKKYKSNYIETSDYKLFVNN